VAVVGEEPVEPGDFFPSLKRKSDAEQQAERLRKNYERFKKFYGD